MNKMLCLLGGEEGREKSIGGKGEGGRGEGGGEGKGGGRRGKEGSQQECASVP